MNYFVAIKMAVSKPSYQSNYQDITAKPSKTMPVWKHGTAAVETILWALLQHMMGYESTTGLVHSSRKKKFEMFR